MPVETLFEYDGNSGSSFGSLFIFAAHRIIVLICVWLGCPQTSLGKPCHELIIARVVEELQLASTGVYAKDPDPYFHSKFAEFIATPIPRTNLYYAARYAAYRHLLDPLGLRGPLADSYRQAAVLGFEDSFGRFVDFAHARLTTVLMGRDASAPPISGNEVRQVLVEVVEIVTRKP